MSKIQGAEILWFMNTGSGLKSIALATNSTLDVNAETSNVTSKDSQGAGLWSEEEVKQLSWSGSSESFFALNANGATYDDIYDAMVSRTPLDVKIGMKRAEGSSDEVGESGWSGAESFKRTGKAIITQLTANY